MQKKRGLISAFIFLIVIAGFGGGVWAGKLYYGGGCIVKKFILINQELNCELKYVIKKHGYAELKGRASDFIKKKISENEASEISIYFRDLENGPTLGINEHAYFAPASLLKLPLLITYLALAEDEPELLNKKLQFHTIKDKVPLQQLIPPSNSIKENTPYTVDELLRRMIVYSDNNAYFTLVMQLDKVYPDASPITQTMKELGIIEPESLTSETITVKSYASLFVQLYNATFLRDKKSSEKALGLLLDADYKDGIVAGVPSGVRVAHKFGEREFGENIKQLHDCGVVYYTDNPYLLCIMTRGQDFDGLPNIISEISKMFYEEVDSRKI